MRLHSLLFRRGGFAAYLALVLGSGATLMLSMPWAGRVGELISFPGHPSPILFFYGHLLLTCVLGLNRGSAVEPLYRVRRHTLLSLPLQLLLGLALVFPYLVFMRTLTPESRTYIPLLAAYVTLIGTLFAGLSFALELACLRRGIGSGLLRSAAALAILGLPVLALLAPPGGWRWLALLSPLVALARLNSGVAWAEALGVFAAPAALAMLAFVVSWRGIEKERYV